VKDARFEAERVFCQKVAARRAGKSRASKTFYAQDARYWAARRSGTLLAIRKAFVIRHVGTGEKELAS